MRLGSLCNFLRISDQILHNYKNSKTKSAQDPDPRHRISMNACKCPRLHPKPEENQSKKQMNSIQNVPDYKSFFSFLFFLNNIRKKKKTYSPVVAVSDVEVSMIWFEMLQRVGSVEALMSENRWFG